MKAVFFLLALFVILATVFARTNKVASCFDNIPRGSGRSQCMQSWEDVKGNNDGNDSDNFCVWCVAGAVPSACVSIPQSQQLPPGVFECESFNATKPF